MIGLPVYSVHTIQKSHIGIQDDCFRVDKSHSIKKCVLIHSLGIKHSSAREFYCFFFLLKSMPYFFWMKFVTQ